MLGGLDRGREGEGWVGMSRGGWEGEGPDKGQEKRIGRSGREGIGNWYIYCEIFIEKCR